MPLIVPPAPRRALIERFPHLPDAGGAHRGGGLVEVQHRLLPRQPAMSQQPLHRRARVGDQGVIVHVEDVGIQRLPVPHQPLILPVPVGEVLEVQRMRHRPVQMQEPVGQDHIQRLPHCVDDAGVREHRPDQADVQEIVRPLVGDHIGDRPRRPEPAEIEAAQLRDGVGAGGRHGLRIAGDRPRQSGDQPQLPPAGDPAVSGQDLLNQRRARPEQATDEDRPRSVIHSRSGRRREGRDQAVNEPFMRRAVVARTRGVRRPTGGVGRGIGGEGLVPGRHLIERTAQGKAQLRPVFRRPARPGDRRPQLRDHRIVRAGQPRQPRRPRQRHRMPRGHRQRP